MASPVPEHVRSRVFADCPGAFLSVAPGIAMAEAPRFDGDTYSSGVFIPRNTWREASNVIDRVENGIPPEFRPGDDVFVSRVDPDILEAFYEAYLSVVDVESRDRERALLNDVVLPTLEGPVLNFLAAKGLEPTIGKRFAIQVNALSRVRLEAERLEGKHPETPIPVHRYSSTQSGQTGYFAGIHIDNWGTPRLPTRRRGEAGIPFGLNLGIEFREVVFLRTGVDSMGPMLRAVLGDDAEMLLDSGYATMAADAYKDLCVIWLFGCF